MFKVMFNQKLRAQFVEREDADDFVDKICTTAEPPDEIAVLDNNDDFLYGFNQNGDYYA